MALVVDTFFHKLIPRLFENNTCFSNLRNTYFFKTVLVKKWQLKAFRYTD